MQRITILFSFLLAGLVILLTRCANPVSPQGGPKDTQSPRVLGCTPPLYSTGVRENSFQIEFDEFITLKNPVSEIFISPPMREQPDSRLRGKSLIVKFEQKLDSNTTYNITFGNAITDLTEGNILRGFSYVFSTGNHVDSLSLQGTLVDAFDHKPRKATLVELYLNNNDTLPLDSLPLHVPPYYITKTDDNGFFMFHNLQDKPCKLFALADQNGDMFFSQPSEKIAFFDSLVRPFYIPPAAPADTSRSDSLKPKADSASAKAVVKKADSLLKADTVKKAPATYPSCALYMYEEADSIQRVLKSTFVKQGIALVTFRYPAKDVRFVPLNFDSVAPWHLAEYSRLRDSVTLWITRPLTDSLVLKVLAEGKVLDTISMELVKKERQKKSPERVESLGILNPMKSAGLNQFRNKMILTFSYPLVRWDFSRVLLIAGKDTVHPGISFIDSLHRSILIDHPWKEDLNYRILIPDSVFESILGLSHDTVRISFKTRSEREFGNLVININNVKSPGQYIVQVLNDGETALYDEKIITRPGKVRFDYLPALKYRVKVIYDRNGNGRWDTGKYRLHLQPEEVFYIPKIIEVRANWDIEESLD